jgi:hypothetical protein
LRVLGNRGLRRIFERIGGWRKLHNEELHNLYSSLNITRTTRSRRMKCAGHIARMARRRMRAGIRWEFQKEGDH